MQAVLTQVMDVLKRFEQKGYKLVAMKVGLQLKSCPLPCLSPGSSASIDPA